MDIPQPPPLPPAMGHRGARGHAPENTMAGLRKAAELGCRWVEFDVKLTADGELILFHDNTLERTTDGKGAVADKSLAEMRSLDAGRWFSPDFTGEAVPTLDEAMAFLAARGIGANVEIKASTGREAETGAAVARALSGRWMGGPLPPFMCSFSAESLIAARQAAAQIPRALLSLKFPRDWPARLEQLGCAAFHVLHRRLNEARVGAIRAQGYRVLAFTVNDTVRAAELLGWGVESIITDYPERILAG
ncbi:MAG: glycerophosphodiester phosphodiesterase [Alphaproteobacteria bacterium]